MWDYWNCIKKKLKIKEKSYFSDISSNAVENTKKNLKLYNQNGVKY